MAFPRKTHMKQVALVLLLLAVPAMAVEVETVIQGQVLDSGSRTPVNRAEVTLIDTGLRTTTDAQGRFIFRTVPIGKHVLEVTRVGYNRLVSKALEEIGRASCRERV